MSCIYKIKEGRKSFTSTDKRIADYILNYRLETVEASVQDLAERTNTSAAAWIRFSKKLGYKGLTALKIGKVVYKLCVNEKQISHLPVCKWLIFKWAQRGMIPRPSDYESAALTN